MNDFDADTPEPESVEQLGWKKISHDIRRHLSDRVRDAKALSTAEVKDLVATVRDAYWLSINAASHDKHIDLFLAKITSPD